MKFVALALLLVASAAQAQVSHSIQVILDGQTYSCTPGSQGDDLPAQCKALVKQVQYRFTTCTQAGYSNSECVNRYIVPSRPTYACVEWDQYCQSQCLNAGWPSSDCVNKCFSSS